MRLNKTKSLLVLLLCWVSATVMGQEQQPFKGEIYNDEYKLTLKMDFYAKNITVPRQEAYGEVDGYFRSYESFAIWLVTGTELVNATTAQLDVINDYGSEDFTAVLKLNADGTYTLTKKQGSTFKFPVRGKWQKIPATLVFKKVGK